MSKCLYFECYSGISGDMAVASLIDLGADVDVLEKSLNSLKLDGFKVEITKVQKNSIEATDFNVIADDESNAYDHDIDYLYGDKEIHFHHHHHSRNLKTILEIINDSQITDNAKRIATDIFTILAKAEAKAHNTSVDEVHFHEVGAVDSIVDIVSFAVCYDNLKIDSAVYSGLYDGWGTVRCQHGLLPIPVPAVTNIVADNGLTLKITDIKGELVTPTGAAIIAAVCSSTIPSDAFTTLNVGIGAGKRENQGTGILRTMIIDKE